MTYAGLQARARTKGARLSRKGKWVQVVDARNKAVIAVLGGESMAERVLLLSIEDKLNWIDVP